MMLFWALAAVATAAVVGLLVRPLLRAGGGGADRLAYDLAVYRDQLAEVERAQAAGELGEEEAAGSRLEIERRILAAADRGAAERTPAGGGPSGRRALAAMLAVLLPAGALAVYGWHGAPRLPGQPLAQRGLPASAPGDAKAEDEAVAALVRRLEERPDDIEGWERLARSLARLQRFADAAEAYRHRLGLGAERPDLHALHGEALTLAAGGIVTPAAQAAFERAGADPRALYFLGEAAAQAGDLDEAIRRWTALEAASAADAPWRPMLRRRIEEAARERGVPAPPAAAAAAPALPPGGEAVMRLSPEERQQAIRGMVAGLEERLRSKPEDREGWRRLVQALHVLGESERLAAALDRAVATYPDDIELRLDLANSQLERAGGDDVLPPDFVRTMREAARIAPDHPQVLWYLGRIAADEGRPDEARQLWTRLLDRLPAASPARAAVEARRAALPEK